MRVSYSAWAKRRKSEKLLRRAAQGLGNTKGLVVDPLRYASPEMRVAVFQRDKGMCRYCGKQLTLETANMEHVIPWKHLGKTDPTNLVTACADCNRAKRNRMDVRPRVLGRKPTNPFNVPL